MLQAADTERSALDHARSSKITDSFLFFFSLKKKDCFSCIKSACWLPRETCPRAEQLHRPAAHQSPRSGSQRLPPPSSPAAGRAPPRRGLCVELAGPSCQGRGEEAEARRRRQGAARRPWAGSLTWETAASRERRAGSGSSRQRAGTLAAGAGSSPSFRAFQSLSHLWVVGFLFFLVFPAAVLVLGEQQTGEPGCVDVPSRVKAGTAHPLPHPAPPRC